MPSFDILYPEEFVRRAKAQKNIPVGFVPSPKLKLAMERVLSELRELEKVIHNAKIELK
jgi:hypothetical protein